MPTIPALGQFGFIADQPPQELPPNGISACSNVRFRDGSAERFAGHVSIFSAPSVTPYYITPFGTATKRFWVHAGLAAVYADDGTTRTNITGSALTGAIDDRFTGGSLSGILILNNGVDVPQYWAGTGTLAAVTSWPAGWTAKAVRTFKNYVVYIGPTKAGTAYPHTVGWSAAADPGTLPTTYDPASTTTDAGDVPLGETPDLLIDCLPLGEVNIIYKEQSMYRMEYIGGQQVFTFKRIPGNYGMLARGCVASTPKGHVVLANGDVVLVDGVSEPKSLLVGRLKKWLIQTQLDSTYYKRSFVVANPTKNEVWVCVTGPGSAVPDRALVWNWIDNACGVRELPNVTYAASGLLDYTANITVDAAVGTVDDASGAYDTNDYTPADSRLILASSTPALYLADSGNSFAGTAISASLERTGLAFDDTDTNKLLKSMSLRVTGTAGTVLSVQFGGSMSAEVAPTWSDPITYTIGQSDPRVYGFASGRFLAYRITSTSSQPWTIKSVDMEIAAMGRY